VALSDPATGKVVETLRATPDHPFFVEGRGWVELGQVGIGSEIVTRAGPNLVVQSVSRERFEQGVAVYNFEVEGTHTYFVGNALGGAWVHNNCEIFFGQKRIAPTFREYSEASDLIRGQRIEDVARALREGKLSADDLPIEYFIHNGQKIAVNNRGYAALRMAGLKPTITRQVPATSKLLRRLEEAPIDRHHPLGGRRMPVTLNQDGSGHLYTIFF
jgi:hypothetical protein